MRIKDLPSPLHMEVQSDTRMPVSLIGVPADLLKLLLLDIQNGSMHEGTGTLQITVPGLGHVRYNWSEQDRLLTGKYQFVVKRCEEGEYPSAFYRVFF